MRPSLVFVGLTGTAAAADGWIAREERLPVHRRKERLLKVVINTCFGGFGVSPACLWELIQRKSPAVRITDLDDHFGASNPHYSESWEKSKAEELAYLHQWWIDNPDDPRAAFAKDLPEGWVLNNMSSRLYDLREKKVYHYDRDNRTDSMLIALIEERGSEWASGWLSKLKVVEIPDGIEFEIDEYDGVESVREKHRKWD